MLSDFQAAAINHVDVLRVELVPQVGELVPVEVGPYWGQLLHPDQLAQVVPAVWVDVRAASVSLTTEGGSGLLQEPTLELVLCTANQAGQDALFSDGVALVSWVLRALVARSILIGSGPSTQLLRPMGAITFTRLASDRRFWAGRITVSLSNEIEVDVEFAEEDGG